MIQRTALIFTLALAALVLFVPGGATAASGCSRFAAPDGSDSAAGTEAAPFRSPQKLAESLSAGQTGCLRAGTYTDSPYVLSPTHGDFTLQGYPGEQAKLVGIVQIPQGVNGVTLSDLSIEGDGSQNTVKDYAEDFTLEGSEITNAHRGRSCMILGSSSAGEAIRPVISENVFHACGDPENGNKDHGIYAAQVSEAEITDNLIYDVAAYAIQLYPNAQHSLVAHNVIYGGGSSIRGGLVFGSEGLTASSDNVVERNVIAYSQTANLAAVWGGPVGTGDIARNNCLWPSRASLGGVVESGDLVANPGFLDLEANDYRLSPASPCLTKVEYDTVAMLMSDESAPPVEPEPEPPVEPKPTPEPEEAAPEPEPQPEEGDEPAPPRESRYYAHHWQPHYQWWG